MAPKLTVKLDEKDNSSNKNITIEREVEMSMSKSIIAKEYKKNIEELSKEEASNRANVCVEVGAKYGPVSATVSSGYEDSSALRSFVSSTCEFTHKGMTKIEKMVKEKFKIGPGDKLYFYQQIFSGPGLEHNLDTKAIVSNKKTAADDSDIYIDIVTQPVDFIESIDVVYGDRPSDVPDHRVRERTSQSDDINNRQRGGFMPSSYVWLVPRYTFNTEKACISFELTVQGGRVEGWKDLAKRSSGDYRYLRPIYDHREEKKITKALLVR